MKVSVILPVERVGGDAERAIDSVLRQEAPFPFELIVVSAAPLELSQELLPETRVRNVVEPDRNPATRRNRAASIAAGEVLAFLDDDARADPRWLANACAYLDAHPDVLAVGGPDPAPEDSSEAELVADTLLAARWIGSGVAAHENRRGVFDVRHASDVALVNLFVRRSAFTGFDESIGYIGEDTRLIETLMERGRVVYSEHVRVVHRRRAFPGPYLRQRWRYRVKTGQLLVGGSRAHRRNPKIAAFLVAGFLAIVLAPLAALPYYALTFVLGARATRLPMRWWPLLPLAFAAHHLTYWLGIVAGAGSALGRRRRDTTSSR
ncbi:MAG: glycosyltransferase [Acidobacteria bacterium]|nr:glycosyltransferase [Acidobacteriota bacterium]MBV9478792.1 glycosyltransferase [Acidobacteriota bacterium]